MDARSRAQARVARTVDTTMGTQPEAPITPTTPVRTNTQDVPPRPCRATQTYSLYHLLFPGEPCFLDFDSQKYKPIGEPKEIHCIGRIAILNSKGEVVLEFYAACPRVGGVKKCRLRAEFSVEWEDLLYQNGAVYARKVESWVAEIVKDRPVVMGGGKHDLTAFFFEKKIWATIWASSTSIDTQVAFSDYQKDGTLGMSTLALLILGETIQTVEHSPVEDADAMRRVWYSRFSYDRDAEQAKLDAQRVRETTTARPNAQAFTKPSTNPYTKTNMRPNTSKTNGRNMQKVGNLTGSAKAKARRQKAA
ncbi:hypothetical protein B0A55_02918 [Friedmanniomyces simplex]|uniref:Uncharacterized protein n=1 Tax=Friedmanniomyces simplex TaxID=329884 RepID=A0A4U0XSK2_9PEZI|nr:hypothetical protein B0A55_02918 [Friedmanniomyces simplex]